MQRETGFCRVQGCHILYITEEVGEKDDSR